MVSKLHVVINASIHEYPGCIVFTRREHLLYGRWRFARQSRTLTYLLHRQQNFTITVTHLLKERSDVSVTQYAKVMVMVVS